MVRRCRTRTLNIHRLNTLNRAVVHTFLSKFLHINIYINVFRFKCWRSVFTVTSTIAQVRNNSDSSSNNNSTFSSPNVKKSNEHYHVPSPRMKKKSFLWFTDNSNWDPFSTFITIYNLIISVIFFHRIFFFSVVGNFVLCAFVSIYCFRSVATIFIDM